MEHQAPLDGFGDVDRSLTLDNFDVVRVDQSQAERFVSEYHYAGGMGNAGMCWGIRQSNTGKLCGVIVFHTPISENVRRSVFGDGYKDRVTELHRMAIHPDCPQNTATWFISRALDSLKEHKPQYWAVLSFADSTEGHDGTVYQAANADYTGTTDERVFYRDDSGRLRPPRINGERISREEAERRGWEVEQREVKHRYVFWLPDSGMSKGELRELSNYEFKEYP